MPPPGYQREDSSGLRRVMQISLSPHLRASVRRTLQEAYPYGQPPTGTPPTVTSAQDMAPSTSSDISLERSSSLTFSVLRYSPTPHQRSLPVSPGYSWQNSPSTPQSCGRSTFRGSPPSSENVQPSLKDSAPGCMGKGSTDNDLSPQPADSSTADNTNINDFLIFISYNLQARQ